MKLKNTVDVSILSANYNNAPYLDDFILSIINSSVWPKEIIFVNDGSPDNSLEIINKYLEYSFLTVIALDDNVGFGNALNVAIDKVSTKYIMRLDPDDCIDEFRIEKQCNYLDTHKGIDVLGSNASYFFSDTSEESSTSSFPLEFEGIKNRYLDGEHGVLHGSVMARSEIFCKYRYIQDNVPAEDYEIFAKMIKDRHTFANLPEPLLMVRIHRNSVSNFLPLSTVKKTYKIRDEIFLTSSGVIKIYSNFLSMKFYRKYCFEESFLRYCFILIAIAFNPKRLIRRIF